MADSRTHWDSTYRAKGDDVSWYQSGRGRSFEMIHAAAPTADVSIIDIGAGASRLADHLLDAGYSDVTLLDISEVALAATRQRLGSVPNRISWIVADITRWKPDRTYEVWHDRAVFHFLTDSEAQSAYVAALTGGTRPGSMVLLSTFALSGPETCSGLPVQRYNAETLAARLGPDFSLFHHELEQHRTPFGTVQDFTCAGFRRR